MSSATGFRFPTLMQSLLVLGGLALLSGTSAWAADAKSSSDTPGGARGESRHVFAKVDEKRVNDKIETPTWKAPDTIRDTRKDLPKASRTWKRVLRDPALRREAQGVLHAETGEMHNAPHFSGRNSIPLADLEQIAIDIPKSLNEKERPMRDMASTTLARGAINVTCGWLELPRHMTKEMRQHDPITGAAVGFVKGATWSLTRTLIGFGEVGQGTLDLARFWAKRPEELDHRPIIEPEWIIQDVWGERIPYLCDTEETKRGHSELTLSR